MDNPGASRPTGPSAALPEASAPAPVRPMITAVVPTRDRLPLLRRAVAAVLEQDYEGHLECIVVFDQSEPQDLDLAVAENRSLRVLTNTRKPGLAGARNTGILAAQGDLVGFCDDDDEWLQGKITRQVHLLQGSPETVLVASGIYVNYRERDHERRPAKPSLDFADFLQDRHTAIHPCTFLLRRDALLGSLGLVDEDIPGSYGEDYDLLLRAARISPVLALSDPLVRVHWHASSFFTSRWLMIIAGLTYLLDRYPDFAGEAKGVARVEGQIAFAHAALGERAPARRWALQALGHSRGERRAYLALVMATGLLRPSWVLGAAQRTGRSI